MKKPKVIRFRCYCMECGAGDELGDEASQRAIADLDRSSGANKKLDPPLAVDSIERILFGA